MFRLQKRKRFIINNSRARDSFDDKWYHSSRRSSANSYVFRRDRRLWIDRSLSVNIYFTFSEPRFRCCAFGLCSPRQKIAAARLQELQYTVRCLIYASILSSFGSFYNFRTKHTSSLPTKWTSPCVSLKSREWRRKRTKKKQKIVQSAPELLNVYVTNEYHRIHVFSAWKLLLLFFLLSSLLLSRFILAIKERAHEKCIKRKNEAASKLPTGLHTR